MKLFLLAFFVAAAVAIPIPDDGPSNIDVIVNGVPEGEALDISHLIDIYTQEKVNGEVVATSNVLQPFTAEAIASAAAEAEAIAATENQATAPAEIQDDSNDAVPETDVPAAPSPIILPEAVTPEIIEDVSQSNPEASEPVVLPEPTAPEVIVETPHTPEGSPVIVVDETVAPVDDLADGPVYDVPQHLESLPEPAPQTGEVYNDGIVSMTMNAENSNVLTTLQKWVKMVVNYVSNGVVAQTQNLV